MAGPIDGQRFTTKELDAMEQAAVEQGMAPSAAKDAAQEMQGGQDFMGGFTGSLKRTGLGLKQAGTYATGTDEERAAVNQAIQEHDAQMADQGPAGKVGEMAGTAAQFMGPQGIASAFSKVAPQAIVRGAQMYLGKPGSVLRSAAQGGAYEAAQPVTPSDAGTDEYALAKAERIAMGAGAGAGAGLAGKFATREGIPTPPERQQLITEAKRLGINLTPAQRTADPTLRQFEEGLASKPGSAKPILDIRQAQQAVLEKKAVEAIGGTGAAPNETELALAHDRAVKGYEPIAKIPKMSIDSEYFDALHALATDSVAQVANPTAVAMAKKLLSTAHKMTGDDFLGQLQKLRTAAFKARSTDPPKAEVYNDLSGIMEDYAERRVGVLSKVKGSNVPADALEQLRKARTELSKIHVIEGAADPITGKMSAAKYMTQEFKRNPASGGVSQSPTAQGLRDVGATARVLKQVAPYIGSSGTAERLGGQQMVDSSTGMLSALKTAGPYAKNYLAAKYYLANGGQPGMLGKNLTPTQNAYIRRMLPGMTIAGQEGATE